MRVRTYVGLLAAFFVAVAASQLTQLNRVLMYEPFKLGSQTSLPLYLVLIAIFALGFLPTATVLLVQHLKRDLSQRRERRAGREAQSLRSAYRRAVDFEADGQWGKAAAELEVVLRDQPDEYSALLRYGAVLRHLGRLDEALEVHRRASVVYPHSVALLYHLAEDYDARGDAEVAREIRSRVLRDFPGAGLQVLRRRRNRALAGRNWQEASRLHEAVEGLLREAGDAEGLRGEAQVGRGLAYQRGVALLEADRAEEAAAEFERLLGEEPRFIPAAIMLGEAELLRDREEDAVARWRAGYDATGSPVFLQRIEDHYIEREQPMKAIETLRSVIAAARNDLLPRFFLGRLYYRLEMLEDALKVLEGVGDRIQSSPTYHFLLARIHERRGEMRRAVESYLDCVHQLGILDAEYQCRACHRRYPEWADRCDTCGAWNSVELSFEEERVSADELGIRDVPVWGVYDDTGEWPAVETKDAP